MPRKKVAAAVTPPVAMKKGQTIEVPTIPRHTIKVAVESLPESFLVLHKWSEKQIQAMADKQNGKAVGKKAPKDPDAEWKSGLYHLADGRIGIPAIAFKQAMVRACKHVGGMNMKDAKGVFFVMGDLLPLTCSDPHMRQDMVRLETKVADIRYRPQIDKWSCTLPIRYNPALITPEQLIHLVNAAGAFVGVGDMRAENSGRTVGLFSAVSAVTG